MMNMGSLLPSLTIALDPFNDPITVVTSDAVSNDNLYLERYLEIMNRENRKVLNWEAQNMTENMIRDVSAIK